MSKLSSKSLLLISNKPEDKAFAQEVAIAAQLTLLVAQTPKEGMEILASEETSVLMVDASSESQYQELEAAIQNSVGLFSERVNSNSTHFISSDDIEKTPYLIQSPLFGNFIMRNYGDPKAAGQHYGRIVRGTLAEQAFGISRLLKPGTKIQVVKFKLSTQKQDAVEAVKNYLIAAKFQSRMATVVANAVDELLMNAMFDAPVDELGKPVLSSTARNAKLNLEGQHSIEMQVGFDGQYVGVAAVDLFGSLDKAKLLSFISKLYIEEEYKVRTSSAGAGIGLATVFRSGGSLVFVSESRVKTEVTVLFGKTSNFREFKDQFRFLVTQFYF